jgi:hypothetical protein
VGYWSPDTIRIITSRNMSWEGRVERMGTRNTNTILVGKPERREHSEDLGVNGRTILKWILNKQRGTVDQTDPA